MLKIIDNVDLKELEKYQFKYKKTPIGDLYDNRNIEVIIKTRKIENADWGDLIDFDMYNDTLYDLIKADLVEKVDE